MELKGIRSFRRKTSKTKSKYLGIEELYLEKKFLIFMEQWTG
jgi:hypothetical protein